MGAGGLLLTPVDRSPYRLSFLLQDHLKKLKFMVRKSVLLNSLTFPMGLPESSTDSFHLLNVIINSKKKKKSPDNLRVKIMLRVLISFPPLHNSLVLPTFWQLLSLSVQQ